MNLDKTFCSFYKQCEHGNICSSALNEEAIAKHKQYWKNIVEYAEKPQCFQEKFVFLNKSTKENNESIS